MNGYLIAFGGRPAPTFLNALRNLSAQDGVTITGAVLCEGPGCYNLALALPQANEAFVQALTMALMPAKWTTTTDPKLREGIFSDEVHNMNGSTFDDWKRQVDKFLAHKCGMVSEDIPDYDYWEAWEDGLTPSEAGEAAYKNAEDCY